MVCAPICNHGILTFYKINITEYFKVTEEDDEDEGIGGHSKSMSDPIYASIAGSTASFRALELGEGQCLCHFRPRVMDTGLRCDISRSDVPEVCNCHIHRAAAPLPIPEVPDSEEEVQAAGKQEVYETTGSCAGNEVAKLYAKAERRNRSYNHCYTCLYVLLAIISLPVRLLLYFLVFSTTGPQLTSYMLAVFLLIYTLMYTVCCYMLSYPRWNIHKRFLFSAIDAACSLLGVKAELTSIFINIGLLSIWVLYCPQPSLYLITAAYACGTLVPCLGLALLINNKYNPVKFLDFCPPVFKEKKSLEFKVIKV